MNNENKKGRKARETDYDNIFAVRLRGLISLTGKKQQEIANSIGISRQALNKWVNGETIPDIFSAVKIADLFNVSTDYLTGRTDISSTNEDIRTVCKVTGLSEGNVRLLSEFDMHKDIINYFLGASTDDQDTKDLTIITSNNNIFYNMIYEINEFCKCLVNAKKYLTLKQKTHNEINGISPINMNTIDILSDISLTELRFQEYGLSISTPDEKLIGIEGVLQKYLSKMLDEIGKKYLANISKERDLNADNNPEEE